jgi:ppGpp synthetase/RelA/SpoT-type nucleotidyltranferase
MSSLEWVKPQYSKGAVDRAARQLLVGDATTPEYWQAMNTVNNWRASHNFPLNTFQVTLRKKALAIDPHRLVAQRIKRMTSIEAKLARFPAMRMSQMQDIGGCRVILNTVKNVEMLAETYEESDLKHKLDDIDDYIANPKSSGYRGIHLVYRYFSDREGPSIYNGLFVEMQLRTKLQHTWATAVETVGTFLSQALKSSLGEEQWLRFFSLMGSAFAIKEKCASLVPDTPQDAGRLAKEIRDIEKVLNVQNALSMYQHAIEVTQEGDQQNHHYFLLVLEPGKGTMIFKGFPRSKLEEASHAYLIQEERIADSPGAEAVLVSVDSIQNLKRAYPNYFLDTTSFLNELGSILNKGL